MVVGGCTWKRWVHEGRSACVYVGGGVWVCTRGVERVRVLWVWRCRQGWTWGSSLAGVGVLHLHKCQCVCCGPGQLNLFNLKRKRKQRGERGEVTKHMSVIKSTERKIFPN